VVLMEQNATGGQSSAPRLKPVVSVSFPAADALIGDTLALVAVHEGNVVHEHYGEGISADSTLISWSMAKSITHALVGMAVSDGLLNIDDTHLFPEWDHDERATISLRHLLAMSSGLEWVEDYVDDKVSDVIDMLFGSGPFAGDHAAFAINKPLEVAPGTLYKYSSGTTNIITKVLARALGEKPGESSAMSAFMQTRLFDPLGMTSAIAKFDVTGNFVGSSYVYATARDFAKFGDLYLNDGVINGERLLPEGWVQYAGEIVGHEDEMNWDYGAHWWIPPGDPQSIVAHGYQGQILWVAPRRNLVLVRLGITDAEFGHNVREQLLNIALQFPETSGAK